MYLTQLQSRKTPQCWYRNVKYDVLFSLMSPFREKVIVRGGKLLLLGWVFFTTPKVVPSTRYTACCSPLTCC